MVSVAQVEKSKSLILLPPADTALLGLHKALDANPKDWTARLIMADWYEERGSPIAQAIRWQVKLRKCPEESSHEPHHGKQLHGWTWFNGDRYDSKASCFLSYNLFHRLGNRTREPVWRYFYKSYKTLRRAQESLWLAWLKWKKIDA